MRYGTRILVKQLAQTSTCIGGSLVGGSLFILLLSSPTDWRWVWGAVIGLALGVLALWLVPFYSGHVR